MNNQLNEKSHCYLPAAADWQMSVIGVGSSLVAKGSVGWKKNGPFWGNVEIRYALYTSKIWKAS